MNSPASRNTNKALITQIPAFSDVGKLIEAANSELDDIDCVSMDFFGILFIHRIHGPTEIERPVAKFIAGIAAQNGVKITWERIRQLRNEIAQRQRNQLRLPDSRVAQDEVLKALLNQVYSGTVPEYLLDDVAAYEMQLHTAMCVARAAFSDWLKVLKKQEKRVFLVSDTDIPATYLYQMVADSKLSDDVEDVISLVDSLGMPLTENVWSLMQDRYELDPNRWIHIGQVPLSNGEKSGEFGIRTLVLKDLSEKQRLGIVRCLASKSRQNPLLRGRYVQQLMIPLERENRRISPLYSDGYNFLGPVLAYFCLSVLNYCRLHNIQHLYFCSREGWSLMQAFEKLLPFVAPEGNYPEFSYLYVSRLAVSHAACARTGLTHLNTSAALLPGSNRDFRDVCRVFGLNIDPLLPFLEKYAVRPDDPIGPRTPGMTMVIRQRFLDMLNDEAFQREVKSQARPAHLLLDRYLGQEGFFNHQDVAMVDIGWLGTIQEFLVDAISYRYRKPRVHGLLFGASRKMPYRDNHESRVHGMLFDRNRFNFPESLIETVKDLFEETCRAPHPSVMGYQQVDSVVEPVFRSNEDTQALAEQAQDDYYAPLRQGIFDSIPRFGAAVAVTGYGAQQLKPWLNFLLTSRLAFPSTAEVQRIRHHTHQDDFSGQHKIARNILRHNRALWDLPLKRLRLDPFVRLYFYIRHALRMLES